MNVYRTTTLATAIAMASVAIANQTVTISANSEGKRFDGIGVVNGGGATSVLLKDYPEQQRSQIMDLVYKPMFGGSMSAMLIEIPGDGNSTQGSMPSHCHYRGDANFHRGYSWWVLKEVCERNPALSVDASTWSAPAWVGNYWSKDMVDYYISWLKGLRHVHGLEVDAVGCHNEKGWNWDFAKMLKQALMDNGFEKVKLHGFDNWGESKMDFLRDMQQYPDLCDALDAVSAHTFSEIQLTPEQRALAESLDKPIWNSEDHMYLKGFDALISIVKGFNENYIVSGASRIINWYDIAGVYPLEPYGVDPATLVAQEPWSGHYYVRESLWGYAHYGQFTQLGWQYVDDGCGFLDDGGSMVTMKNPDTGDYSIIFETKNAHKPQTVTVKVGEGLSTNDLCVWVSNENDIFKQAKGIKPRGCKFSITLKPGHVYSLSTTTGQQKGSFDNIPEHKAFPIPYADDFDGYGNGQQWGYLPHYFADIIGCFEITPRPDGEGYCLRQTVGEETLSWAPVWHHYTIIGDADWSDYEVSANVFLNPGDEAAIMGRLCDVGSGYGVWAKGYYLKIDDDGQCSIVLTRGKLDQKELIGDAEQQALILARKDVEIGGEYTLAKGNADNIAPCQWHNLALRFDGDDIIGSVDGKEVVRTKSDHYTHGMAGMMAPANEKNISTPYFDNFNIRPLGRTETVTPTKVNIKPLYTVK